MILEQTPLPQIPLLQRYLLYLCLMRSLTILCILFSVITDCSAQTGGILVSVGGMLTIDSTLIGNKICYNDTLYNNGDGDLIITSFSVTGLNDSDFSVIGLNTPFTLKAHSSYLFEICGTPSGLGLHVATLIINITSNNIPHSFNFVLGIFGLDGSSSVLQESTNRGFSLGKNFPNPSTGITTFSYTIPT